MLANSYETYNGDYLKFAKHSYSNYLFYKSLLPLETKKERKYEERKIQPDCLN